MKEHGNNFSWSPGCWRLPLGRPKCRNCENDILVNTIHYRQNAEGRVLSCFMDYPAYGENPGSAVTTIPGSRFICPATLEQWRYLDFAGLRGRKLLRQHSQ